MAFIQQDCPHCGTKNCGFISFGEYRQPNKEEWLVSFRCGFCHEGLFATYDGQGKVNNPHKTNGDPEDFEYWELKEIYPLPTETTIPLHLPENIKSAFTEAKDTLENRQWNSAGMGFWRTLEIATKHLCPGHKKQTLYERLKIMSETHMIPNALFDVGDFIRDQGNEAKHEETIYDEKPARILERFAQLFLIYTFELPEEVKAVKGSSGGEEQGGEEQEKQPENNNG